jgi:hypothetical protein
MRKFPDLHPNPETIFEDLLALAQQKRARTSAALAAASRKGLLVREANRKARQRATVERWHREHRAPRAARWRPPLGQRRIDKFVCAMAPGDWHGMGDLLKATGLSRSARGTLSLKAIAQGLVERRRNPAWRRQMDPWEIMAAGGCEPIWLYRLTPAGEALRSQILMLQGMCD